RDHAVVVASIVERRDRGRAQRAHALARALQLAVLGDVQYLRQPGVLVAAQRGVHHVIGDDARLLGVVADPAQRLLSERLSFGGGEPDSVGGNGVHWVSSNSSPYR